MLNGTLRNSHFLKWRLKIFSILKKYLVCILVAFILITIAVGLIWLIVVTSVNNLVVKTKVGVIRGIKAEDGDYSMFMGIPYAKVNIDNPFGHSVPYSPFEGIFNADSDTSICPQIEEYNFTTTGSLDCLHLNIYVPNSASNTNRLPVLVFIYGGRYEVGFAGIYVYGPKFLVRQNIILVTLNYRVGPYGFLCLDIPEVPGNQGLKDQVLALKWVKENIESFGGDSKRITISGESSGGQNVDFHVMYTKEHLFDRAIIGGGAKYNSATMAPANQSIPLLLAKDLGYKTNDIKKALHFLSKQKTNDVITSSGKLKLEYKPCVEKEFENTESFITEFPKSEIKNVKRISVLISQSSEEFHHELVNNFGETSFRNIFRDEIQKNYNFNEEQLDIVEEYVREYYIGDKIPGMSVKQEIADFISDLFQNYASKKKIDQYLENGAKKIYYYMFSYAGRRNFIKLQEKMDLKSKGAAHVDEIGYLFDVSYFQEPITKDDQLIIDRITKLWANFVKYGDPTPMTRELLPVKWIPVTQEVRTYLNIDLNMSLGVMPFSERMAFWDNFENLENETLEVDDDYNDISYESYSDFDDYSY